MDGSMFNHLIPSGRQILCAILVVIGIGALIGGGIVWLIMR